MAGAVLIYNHELKKFETSPNTILINNMFSCYSTIYGMLDFFNGYGYKNIEHHIKYFLPNNRMCNAKKFK